MNWKKLLKYYLKINIYLILKETEKKPVKKDVSEITSNNIIARNINRILFQEKKPTRNELFARGRMAYIVELDDEEEDVPSTLMRSVLDCPSEQSNDNINANNELNNVRLFLDFMLNL